MKTKTIRAEVILRIPEDSDVDVRGAFKDFAAALVRGSVITLDEDAVDDVGYQVKVREWKRS